MFVFSELKGKYEVKDGGLCFKDYPSFYISSVDSSFLNQIYLYYYEQKSIVLGRFTFDIVKIEPVENLVYNNNHEYIIQTISPVCCYKTDEKRYITYFHPKSQDFEMSIRDNLERKLKILGMDTSQEFFEILEVIREKKVRVKFKRMVIQSYNVRMKIRVSNEYLKMMMHTGMGARNSGGFGMIQIIK